MKAGASLCAVVFAFVLAGCCPLFPSAQQKPAGGGGGGDNGGGGAPAAATERAPHRARGHVSWPDGKPIHVPGATVSVQVSGLSAAAENAGFAPPLDENGDYDAPLPGGMWQAYAKVKLQRNGQTYLIDLEPVQDNTVSQDGDKGLVQDFVWRLSGLRKGQDPKPGDFTHWYGCSVSLVWQSWRDDIRKPVPAPPKGTKLTFTLVPKSPLVDGSEGKTLTFERTFEDLSGSGPESNNLPDIPLADYTISGVEVLPDGTRVPMLFQAYPKPLAETFDVRFAPGSMTGCWPANLNVTPTSK